MRRKPYTKIGISRIPCARCGKPSSQQWQICSLNNEWKGLCQVCDVELNKLVLGFIGMTNMEVLVAICCYRKKLGEL